MMFGKSQRDRSARLVRASAGIGIALLLASNFGCMTTETVSNRFDSENRVSQSVAKRDLGIDYLASRRTAMAIRELQTALKLDPSDPATHLWLGEAYRRKGKTEQAQAFLMKAIALSAPDQHTSTRHAALLNLSALLSQLGQYEESIEYCEALADDPTFATPWRPLTNCGWSLYQLGRLEEASDHFEEALDFFPRFGPALLNLGILRTKQGKKLSAINAFESALDSGRLHSSAVGEAHFRLGEIYVGLGRRDKAVVHFNEATEKAPYEDWGSQSQAYLDLLH
jgi:tetratricopeptide (TPR) repeat protein